MTRILFRWTGETPIESELIRPLNRVSAEFFIPNSGPRYVTCWRVDGSGLRISTEMHDLAEKCEVGALTFELVSKLGSNEKVFELDASFRGQITASRLLIEESGATIESGVILESGMGSEIVIVAGAYPYSLTVLGRDLGYMSFDPEYPLDLYQRERMR